MYVGLFEYIQYLIQCLAHSRYSITSWWTNERVHRNSTEMGGSSLDCPSWLGGCSIRTCSPWRNSEIWILVKPTHKLKAETPSVHWFSLVCGLRIKICLGNQWHLLYSFSALHSWWDGWVSTGLIVGPTDRSLPTCYLFSTYSVRFTVHVVSITCLCFKDK